MRRGSSILLASQWARLFVQLAGIVVMSQLLSPHEFGIVAMVTAIVSLAAVIGDFGLSLSALTAGPLNQRQRSTLFWTNGIVGLVLFATISCLAPLVSRFYSEPALTPVTVALGIPFLLNALSVQFKVELNVRAAWRRLAVAETAPPALALCLGAALAVGGLGHWALVGQQLASSAIQLGLAARLSEWRPGRPGRARDVKQHLAFGRDTLLVQTVNYASSNADSILIGHQIGPDALGTYNRAFQLASLPILQIASPTTRAILPRLGKANDDEDFRDLLARFQLILAYSLLAVLSLMAALAPTLIVFALGDAWAETAAILRVLALASSAQAVGYVYYWAFLARRATMVLAFTELAGRIAMIAAMVVLVRSGSVAVAWAVVGGQFLLLVSSAIAAQVRLGIPIHLLAAPAIRAWLVFGSAFALSSFVAVQPGFSSDLAAFSAALAAWVSCVATAAVVSRRVRNDLRAVVALARH